MEAVGLLKHRTQSAKIEWSKRNVIAIHLNSMIYFYQENQKVYSFIDLNKYKEGFQDNYLVDMKFNEDGSKLLLVDIDNNISLYDVGKHMELKLCSIFCARNRS